MTETSWGLRKALSSCVGSNIVPLKMVIFSHNSISPLDKRNITVHLKMAVFNRPEQG
jgi:hypothetical protein